MFKYIKRLLRRRNNGGFTLVEVVVSIALLGIMLIGVLGFTAPLLANVAERQQDAQAVMLMEAIDSYITNNLRNAKFVKIIANVNVNDSNLVNSTEYKDAMAEVKSMAANTSGGEDVLRCISFRWMKTGVKEEYKLVLMNEHVDASAPNFGINKLLATEVMGDAIYTDMYIVPKFNMIESDTSTGSTKRNIGIENLTRVFKNQSCYSVSDYNRRASTAAYEGQSFNQLTTISSQFLNSPDSTGNYKYKAYDIYDAFTYDADGNYESGYSTLNTTVATSADNADIYYPETFIFYVVRDLTKLGDSSGGPVGGP